MQRYFISKEELSNSIITNKDDIYHITKVMRFEIGSKISVSDESQTFVAVISALTSSEVKFEKLETITADSSLPFFVTLFQGYPKGDKMDDIVKNTTQFGVSDIVGVITKRSIFKLDEAKKEAKINRFNRIAKEASEQSERTSKSRFLDILPLKKIDFSLFDYLILANEESSKNGEMMNLKCVFKNLQKGQRVAIFVGPEGGIDPTEIAYLTDQGFVSCGLGPRILRSENAAIYLLSAMSYHFELR